MSMKLLSCDMKIPAVRLIISVMCFFSSALIASASDFDRSITSLCDSLVMHIPDSGKVRLAVLPFEDKTGNKAGTSIAEYIITKLVGYNRFVIVDRMEFQKVMQEIELSQTDVIDSASAIKAGKMLTANYLVTGSISAVFGKNRITANVIRTETSEIISSASTAIMPAELEGIKKELLGERMSVSASLFRSAVAPGWGQFYSKQPWRGGISLAAFLGTLGVTLYQTYQTSKSHNDYDDYTGSMYTSSWYSQIYTDTAVTHEPYAIALARYESKKDVLYNDYSKQFDRTIIWAIVTGAVYVLNLADAGIAGAQARARFKPYFGISNSKTIYSGVCVRF